MERRGVVVGVLAVVAVALAAGAVAPASPQAPSAAGGGASIGSPGATGVALGGVLWLVALAALIAGGVALAVARLRDGGDGGERVRRRFVALVLGVATLVAGVLLVAVRAFGDGEGPRRQENLGAPLVQGTPEASTATGGPGPGVVLAVLLALALAAVAVVAYRRVRSDDATESASTDEAAAAVSTTDSEADAAALGSAAGRAASHLDGSGSPPENEVVRAWFELASVLPVARPASSTPREFAAAATAAGVDAEDVAELAALFEAVRYGDRDADGERARRAVAALERIETAHGDGSDRSSAGETDEAAGESP
ncbi:DUF4129 domain-containing protein [Halorubellus sp. JP-L1]|uniref:DUF4129 domain-containing protein n=1 Tax=Halorubellus sp. JP-L1 TaxID=2715753 RepID=UPI00140BEDD3|nr:DUF4129 domain-containing protein [Halorubellus sp. JP-L1]NHN41906.1 DUF4129 domain-containing protein [Halorubellus sp. JP-L1]